METNIQEQIKSLYRQDERSSEMLYDDEDYVLTPDEEQAVLDHERKRIEDHYRWKMADRGQNQQSIEATIAAIDWSKDPNLVREDVLRRANSNKLQELWYQQRRAAEKLQADLHKKVLESTWTAKMFFRHMSWRSETLGRALIVNCSTLPLIKALCFMLSRDERFKTELGYSFSKGLMIRGTSGLGKTHLVRCVADNERSPVKIYSMLEIADVVKLDGDCLIPTDGIVYLDDVGSESAPVKYFGTEINWLKDFIEVYYASGKPFNRLLISTNLSADDIEAKYGYRVRSRMREMFNVLDVEGEDLRG